jgi:GAF domain-containing protein
MDEETRKIILLFLQAFKRYQAIALSHNTALAVIIQMSPKDRAALTADRVQAAVMDARQQAQRLVAQQTAELEHALQDDKHALSTLQAFASLHLKDR